LQEESSLSLAKAKASLLSAREKKRYFFLMVDGSFFAIFFLAVFFLKRKKWLASREKKRKMDGYGLKKNRKISALLFFLFFRIIPALGGFFF